jgi:hypothetical protein
MDICKEIIRPGCYTYISDKTGLPEKMTVTSDTVKHFCEQGNAMLAAGLSVPVPMEHQPDAKPMTAAEKAAKQLENNAGWVKKYEINDDKLFGVLDILDQKIREKLPTTIKFTSPWINSFTDGSGKRWDGVISHVALTTRPRITKQIPFQSMAASLSLVGAIGERPFTAGNVADGLGLSLAGLVKKVGNTFKPEYPMAFSLLVGAKLSEEEMKEVEKGEEEREPEKPKEEGRESPLDSVEPVEDESCDVSIHETIGHLLKALGFNPPPGMDETTFERDLYETLMAKVQELGGKAMEPEKKVDEPESVETDNPVIQESPNMYASMEEVNKITDPKERKMAGALFSLQQENAKAKQRDEERKKRIAASAKVARDQRIAEIAKHIPTEDREALLSLAGSPEMQIVVKDDESIVEPMASALKIWEKAAQKLSGTLLSFKAGPVTEQPNPVDGDARSKAVVEEILKNTGGIPKPQGAIIPPGAK